MATKFDWALGLPTVGDGVSTVGTYNTTDSGSFSHALQSALRAGRGAYVIPGVSYTLTDPVTVYPGARLVIPQGATIYVSATAPLTGSPVAGSTGFILKDGSWLGGGGTLIDSAGRSGANHVVCEGSNITVDGLVIDIETGGDDETNSVHCFNSDTETKENIAYRNITVYPNVATVTSAMANLTGFTIENFHVIPKVGETSRACRAAWSTNAVNNVYMKNCVARNLGTSGTGLVDGILRDRNASQNFQIDGMLIQTISMKDLAAPIGGMYFAGTIGLQISHLTARDFNTLEFPFLNLVNTVEAGSGDFGRNAVITDSTFYDVGKSTATAFQAIRLGVNGFKDVHIETVNFDECPYGAIQILDGNEDVVIQNSRFVAAAGNTANAIQFDAAPVPTRWYIQDNVYRGTWTAPYANPGAVGVYRFNNNWNMTDTTFSNLNNP